MPEILSLFEASTNTFTLEETITTIVLSLILGAGIGVTYRMNLIK